MSDEDGVYNEVVHATFCHAPNDVQLNGFASHTSQLALLVAGYTRML